MSNSKEIKQKGRPKKLSEEGTYKNCEFYNRLNKCFGDRNESQEAVAKALGTTRQTFGNWLSGRNQPDFEKLIALAKYYNVSVDYLLGLSEDSTLEPDMKKAVKCTGLSRTAIEGLQDHLTAELEQLDRRITEPLETLLCSDKFYDMLIQLRSLQNTSRQFNDTDDIKRIDFDDKCDMLRYRVSKIMEKISDEFDRRENNG